jgi:S-adenosylmethionine:tRNA ribosyltransferase-isomerase
MDVQDFHYELPEGLIAQSPLDARSASRLLQVQRASGQCVDRQFVDLPELLKAGDLLVFNNTRVIPARLQARKETGGEVEVMVERLIGEDQAMVQLRANRKPQPGTALKVDLGGDAELELSVLAREGEFWRLAVAAPWTWPQVLEAVGHMPLPPYITRPDSEIDRDRYQTVYASVPGAVAAPTAGLHFDQAILDALQQRGVAFAQCTLHVGAGTFQPVRTQDITEHQMHAEWLEVDAELVSAVKATRAAGGRIIAVGTTALRALETAAAEGELAPYRGDTQLFIYPGYTFKVVDALITNFHLPGSTLLMLVSALAGRSLIMQSYAHAVAERYRFFSYGDAMFIE